MTGKGCPTCGQEVMSFGQYCRELWRGSVFNIEVKRSTAVAASVTPATAVRAETSSGKSCRRKGVGFRQSLSRFRQHLSHVETAHCEHCGAELTPSRWFLVLLAMSLLPPMGLTVVLFVIGWRLPFVFLIPFVSALVVLAGTFFLVWKFVPWRPVVSSGPRNEC